MNRFKILITGKKVNIKFAFQEDKEGSVTGLIANGRDQIITFNKK
jgi:hypothetical protein